MSAMVASSVSPLRWLMIVVYLLRLASSMVVEGLGQRADLVDLYQDAVSYVFFECLLEAVPGW